MLLAKPDTMRANFGVEEVATLTGLYMAASLTGDDPEEDAPEGRTEDEVLSWAIERASSRAVSYLAERYPVLTKQELPEGVALPTALVNAVCDIARYFLTGTPVQETDPIVTRFGDAIAWLKEIASGVAGLPGLDDAGEGGELVTGSVAFASNDRQWSTTA